MKRPTWMLVWSDEMSMGVPEIDEAHQHFIHLINELNRSITEGMVEAEIRNRLRLVIDDAERHFSQEEELLLELRYPDAGFHAQIHGRVMYALQTLQQQFVPYGMDSGWVDAGLMIKSILIDHILKEDVKYANYYRNSRRDGLLRKDSAI